MKNLDVLIIGGGAAGFFTAINVALENPNLSIAILEKGNQFLGKVKVSGGGRCNVTHACFDPKELIQFYPRGSKELRGPFHKFQPGDMFEWLQEKGVELKIESDNRVFPVSDNSQTIIDCFLAEAKRLGIQTILQCGVNSISKTESSWAVNTNKGDFSGNALVVASGSSAQVLSMITELGVAVTPLVPSLFTFNVKHFIWEGLQGVSLPLVDINVVNSKLSAQGPLLFTHWGLSGPAVLRLSAWGAEWFAQANYRFDITIDFVPNWNNNQLMEELKELRINLSKKKISANTAFGIPHKLWQRIIAYCELEAVLWADVSNTKLIQLSTCLKTCQFPVNGKSTFKEEFVTCGGVELKEIDFKTMQHKQFSNLYFTGEVLNIDAITGGFNFQAAWTTGFIAAQDIASNKKSR